MNPSLQIQVDVRLTTWRAEFSGQTIFVHAFIISSHLKPLSQLQRVFSKFGDEFKGHYWQVLLIEIDFELQTHVLLTKVSFLLHATAHDPFTILKPGLQRHPVPLKDEFGGH